jgi:hypothetical protein
MERGRVGVLGGLRKAASVLILPRLQHGVAFRTVNGEREEE